MHNCKNGTQTIKMRTPTAIASEVAKCHPSSWGAIFGTFGERNEGMQNSRLSLLFGTTALSTAIFHFKPYKIAVIERKKSGKSEPCLLVETEKP